jgi:hypothetical protein
MAVPRILDSLRGAATEAGGALLGRLQHVRLPGLGQSSTTEAPETAARRWRAVTVLCSPEQVGTGADLPGPLAALGDRVELRITPAPGDRGTELAARYRDRPSDDDLRALRSALREAKQLMETGEVLRVEPQPHGHRKPTPQGAAVEGMAARASEEGTL